MQAEECNERQGNQSSKALPQVARVGEKLDCSRIPILELRRKARLAEQGTVGLLYNPKLIVNCNMSSPWLATPASSYHSPDVKNNNRKSWLWRRMEQGRGDYRR